MSKAEIKKLMEFVFVALLMFPIIVVVETYWHTKPFSISKELHNTVSTYRQDVSEAKSWLQENSNFGRN